MFHRLNDRCYVLCHDRSTPYRTSSVTHALLPIHIARHSCPIPKLFYSALLSYVHAYVSTPWQPYTRTHEDSPSPSLSPPNMCFTAKAPAWIVKLNPRPILWIRISAVGQGETVPSQYSYLTPVVSSGLPAGPTRRHSDSDR